MCISDNMQTTGKFPTEISSGQCSASTLKALSTISNIMYIQPFTTGVNWPETER